MDNFFSRYLFYYLDLDQSCSGNITENTFDFPKNGLEYGNNMNCSWTIQRSYSFAVTFERFDIEECEHCGCDYLRFDQQEFLCGGNLPDKKVKLGQTQMRFQSDGSVAATGFKIKISNLEGRGKIFPTLLFRCVFHSKFAFRM